ncbi:hypothetical protein CKM354_000136600 [Cercospora kikuchii]|uniref:Uncharacterized protein n=1 Tax=Cercospora kikuchii TaxID=84275 RepID=A0A9P3F8M8_9PEZI|nr:uncharacterized protein CKM354_000136600 [Cercospora kikuchii]GIZ37938.1 hypothetical protein CKM354_000136600 [Cercospora kikuchii]
MTRITTIVEIDAPPSLVRSLFLDFSSLREYHSGHFGSITITETKAATSTNGDQLSIGDKLRINAGGMNFKAVICENTAKRFAWRGGLEHVMIGEHSFWFEDSTAIPGGTRLVHGEVFTGGLVSIFKPFMKVDEKQMSPGFEKFNQDIKKWAEAKKGEKQI